MQETLIILVFFPLSFFIGYKLRNIIPPNRRFTVGFFGMVAIYSLFLACIMFTKINWPSYLSSIGTGIGLGFSLGIGISPRE